MEQSPSLEQGALGPGTSQPTLPYQLLLHPVAPAKTEAAPRHVEQNCEHHWGASLVLLKKTHL